MGGLFGSPKPPPPPAPAPRQPDAQDPAVIEAKKKRLAMELQRNGRDSTILSGNDNVGGGRTTLGA